MEGAEEPSTLNFLLGIDIPYMIPLRFSLFSVLIKTGNVGLIPKIIANLIRF